MEFCMRRSCVWASGTDGKCHVPCMDPRGGRVVTERQRLRNQGLCRCYHRQLRQKALRAAAVPECPKPGPPQGKPVGLSLFNHRSEEDYDR